MSSRWHATCRKQKLKLTDLETLDGGWFFLDWFQSKTNTKHIWSLCILQKCQIEDIWPVFPLSILCFPLHTNAFWAPCCSCCFYTGGVLDLDICAEECKIDGMLVPTSTHLSSLPNLTCVDQELMLIVHNGIASKPSLDLRSPNFN